MRILSPTGWPATLILTALTGLSFVTRSHATAWTADKPLITARGNHTATLLPDGRLLVVAGGNSTGFVASAELRDPTTGNWTLSAGWTEERTEHTATLL